MTVYTQRSLAGRGNHSGTGGGGGAGGIFFLTFIPSGLMYMSTLKAINLLDSIRFRVITAGLAKSVTEALISGWHI